MANETTNRKLDEMVLYIARRCEGHSLFGKVKLNKILFFSDMNAYVDRGEQITDTRYIKHQFGPVPEGIDDSIRRLADRGDAYVEERRMPDLTAQKRVVAHRSPNLTGFAAADIATVDAVIEWMRPMSANEISELSHGLAGWSSARMGEPIPMGTALIPHHPIPLTADELTIGEELGRSQTAGR